ncbi:hypothetical protein ACSTS3_09440 [Aquimarina muelleri]|uniref:hypothetical protein n=1 Tax=Aquimarina muelleri TaxID=279356 RepID=UPI003F686BEC
MFFISPPFNPFYAIENLLHLITVTNTDALLTLKSRKRLYLWHLQASLRSSTT